MPSATQAHSPGGPPRTEAVSPLPSLSGSCPTHLTLIQECSRLWAMVILLLEEPPTLVSAMHAMCPILP